MDWLVGLWEWLAQFVKATFGTTGIPVIFVIMGIVELIKKTGKVSGNWLLLSSLITGLVIGTMAQLSNTVPSGLSGWLSLIITSIVWGLIPCGVYEAIKSATIKGIQKVDAAILEECDCECKK